MPDSVNGGIHGGVGCAGKGGSRGDTATVRRPASRTARLSAIEQVLASHLVTSQSQLSAILSDQGIEVTQATLSRDLDEVHAVKTRLKDGTMAYTVAGLEPEPAAGVGEGRAEQQLSRVLSDLVTSVAAAQNQVVVHTPSGAAQYVAMVLDKQPIDGILGTIAGDDTVLVICPDSATAKARCHWFVELASA